MEPKKSDKANLENKRPIFFRIGLILSLSLVLLAFDWTSNNYVEQDLPPLGPNDDVYEEPPIERTFPKVIPPKPKPIVVLDIIKDEDEEIEDLELIDLEFTESDSIPQNEILFSDEEKEKDELPYNPALLQQKPEFPGGDDALLAFIQKNARYPEMAREIDLEGTVHVSFVVNENGKVTDVKVERCHDDLFCDEALRVARMIPDWKPGKQMGRAVKTIHYLPIRFVLTK